MHRHLLAAVLATLVAVPALPAAAAPQHAHEASTATHQLQLNAGRKWQTDAPLRANMASLRTTLQPLLPALHADTLKPDDYRQLAATVEARVTDIVRQCRLPAEADAQLHIIVGELFAGAGQMKGTDAAHAPRDGAIKVVAALNDYGRYFDDPGFKPLGH
ncbi:MAG TPA: hypothetical protein VFM52_01640 [Rhodanobacter sp.]|nr:hypothetical protein [Rhodanobacter sp.]